MIELYNFFINFRTIAILEYLLTQLKRLFSILRTTACFDWVFVCFEFQVEWKCRLSGFKIPKYKLLFGQQDASKRKKSIVNLL